MAEALRTYNIKYLLERKFPLAKVFGAATILSRSPRARDAKTVTASYEDRQEYLSRAKAYELELKAKNSSDLQNLANQEKALEKEAADKKAALEESQRFFNLSGANADFEHWARTAYWKIEEAVALSFGKRPSIVNWNSLKPYVNISPFVQKYSNLYDLAERAVTVKQLTDPITPGMYIAWVKRIAFPFPAKLEEMVAAQGNSIMDWQTVAEELHSQLKSAKMELDMLKQERTEPGKATVIKTKEKPLGTKERESMLKLIIGMAAAGYRYDPKEAKNSAVPEIANDLHELGIPITDDTVRKYLKEAAELMPGKPEQP